MTRYLYVLALRIGLWCLPRRCLKRCILISEILEFGGKVFLKIWEMWQIISLPNHGEIERIKVFCRFFFLWFYKLFSWRMHTDREGEINTWFMTKMIFSLLFCVSKQEKSSFVTLPFVVVVLGLKITVNPESKAVLAGQFVKLCCRATGHNKNKFSCPCSPERLTLDLTSSSFQQSKYWLQVRFF